MSGDARHPIRPGLPREEETTGEGVPGATFRDALARWASGVAILAVRDDDRVYATTATGLMSVSLRPPLVAVALGATAQVLPFLRVDAPFGVSILTVSQRRHATIFADAFPVGASPFPRQGTPVIAGALAGLTCTVLRRLEAGDHQLVLGRVDDAELGPDAPPLLYFERAYGSLTGS